MREKGSKRINVLLYVAKGGVEAAKMEHPRDLREQLIYTTPAGVAKSGSGIELKDRGF